MSSGQTFIVIDDVRQRLQEALRHRTDVNERRTLRPGSSEPCKGQGICMSATRILSSIAATGAPDHHRRLIYRILIGLVGEYVFAVGG